MSRSYASSSSFSDSHLLRPSTINTLNSLDKDPNFHFPSTSDRMGILKLARKVGVTDYRPLVAWLDAHRATEQRHRFFTPATTIAGEDTRADSVIISNPPDQESTTTSFFDAEQILEVQDTPMVEPDVEGPPEEEPQAPEPIAESTSLSPEVQDMFLFLFKSYLRMREIPDISANSDINVLARIWAQEKRFFTNKRYYQLRRRKVPRSD
ncbi:hypothetical protein TWF281_006785 [Arthrobotrys megalospora]